MPAGCGGTLNLVTPSQHQAPPALVTPGQHQTPPALRLASLTHQGIQQPPAGIVAHDLSASKVLDILGVKNRGTDDA
jgi:hypothetical protein